MHLEPGTPTPLGATLHARPDEGGVDGGVNVAVWAPRATGVSLCLFDDDGAETTVPLPACTDGVWHGYAPGVGAGALYGFRVDGAHDPLDGARFDAGTVLLDPYARAVVGGIEDGRSTMRGVVVDPAFDWGDDAPPRVPWERTVVYETHVKGMTMQHPDVPEELRGTFAGLAHPAVLDHLVGLGATTVELLPVHHFATEPGVAARGLVNYWGYSSAGWFAPHAGYASGGDRGEQVAEFKHLVRALHARGLEVVLDVVFNHTCEGGPDGPLVHLRGLDDGAYYRQHEGEYIDLTGCGNTVTTGFDAAVDVVLDSLRYWVEEMHVDGFRVDLASTLGRSRDHHVDLAGSVLEQIARDPVLSGVKLVAEPWDATAEGYLVGRFPTGWAEWNDRFRDDVRDFWRGCGAGVGPLAARLTASRDVFRADRGTWSSVNFVTAHDGYTLRDLVSYEQRHNERNGEDNRDGHGDNRSWNGGVEGPTEHPRVRAVRRRQARNLLTTLLLSGGVPMLAHGDELGRTQGGNNNAYCHDDATTWVDWEVPADWRGLTPFVRALVDVRARHPHLARLGADDVPVRWWHADGRAMDDADWKDPALRTLALEVLAPSAGPDASGPGAGALLVLLHAGPDALTWRLPEGWTGRRVDVLLETAEHELGAAGTPAGDVVADGRSVVVLAPSA